MAKITDGARSLLQLSVRGAKGDGWAPVSKMVWPMLAHVPEPLLEREQLEDGRGRCRITERGRTVLDYT